MHSIDTRMEYVSTGNITALQNALQGIPITVGKNGATCSAALSEDEVSHVIQVLDYGPQRTNTSNRFIRGDFWNSLPKKYGNRIAMLRTIYPNKSKIEILRIYRDWKECGMIAKRWLFLKRDYRIAWGWYRGNFPNEQSRQTQDKEDSMPTGDLVGSCLPLEGKHKGVERVLFIRERNVIRIQPDPTAVAIEIDVSHLLGFFNAADGEECVRDTEEADDFAELEL